MGQADVFGLGDGLPRLRRGLRVTHLGDERLVLDPASGVVHTVRGPAVRTLDAVLGGRPANNDEVLAALTGAGIVELRGVGRREALILAGSAAALVASVSLPSALAAASTFNLPAGTGGGSATTTEYTLTSGHRLYRLYDLADSGDNTSFRLTVTFPTTIEVLLVGGGGPGGEPGTAVSEEFFGGGGGGGEVVFVNLGRVTSGTVLDFSVAGQTTAASGRAEGRQTVLTVGSDSVTALGGGRGAARIGTTLTAASAGGSGGGGNPSTTVGGGSVSGTSNLSGGRSSTSRGVNLGGTGDESERAAAGGGGVLAAGSGASSSTAGGNGGDGITLFAATNWALAVAEGDPDPTSVQNIFGAGGGGAGAESGGTTNATAGRLGGRPSSDDVSAASGGGTPNRTSGSGGGGGIRYLWQDGENSGYAPAGAGTGASGVAWVRTIS